MWNGYGCHQDNRKEKVMDERNIKLTALALLTTVKQKLNDITIPASLDISGEDMSTIQKADDLLKNGAPAITDRNHLESIFNVLNGNKDKKIYKGQRLDYSNGINYPCDETSIDSTEYFINATNNINVAINDISYTDVWLSRFAEVLETELTYMPGTLQDPDISLFDQAKLCAAFTLCLSSVSEESSNDFLLYSMDFSGIQDFIYTIQSKGALKTLRARSFYLEILMENAIDDILDVLGLSRINVLYSGGGHSYLLLPNDEVVINKLNEYNKELNNWLVDIFDISLYVGHGYASCSADVFRNIPEGSYSELFRNVSRMISRQKSNRYDASQLIDMNSRVNGDYTRECKVCRRLGKLNSNNECSICSAIKDFSKDILKANYFVVDEDPTGVPLLNKRYLKGYVLAPSDTCMKRSYRKKSSENEGSYGLWIGDYTTNRTLEEMATDAKNKGCIDRIGIIRADVDNLGTAISIGFDKTVGGNIMRTMALSRQLSLFFKSHINGILSNPSFSIGDPEVDKGRNASICYSGGDDLFIVGEWDDIIGFSVDISNAFDKFTQGTLSISAGIGIYDSKYPISRIAYETADLEDKSKKLPGKRAVTLLEDGCSHSATDSDGHVFDVSDGTYTWSEFEQEVIGEKYAEISDFLGKSSAYGMSFMYKLLELVRNQSEKINFARFVYVLSRLEPGKDSPPEDKTRYKQFSNKLTEWIKDEKDRRQLKTAMTLYAYMTRNEEEN